MSADCLFCRIVAGEIPATVVRRSDGMLAFEDIAPKAPVHVLVIPRRHVGSLSEATDTAELGELMRLAAEVARQEGVAGTGYRVLTNIGADGGQSVGHLHLHVLGGRALGWPPG